MDATMKLLEKTLRQNSLFVTKARKVVFIALWDNEPQTMHEIENKIDSKINRTSIYRSVDLFIDLGIVNKIQIGWKYKLELSDVFVEHHHHITCKSCNTLIAVHENIEIERLISEIATKHSFTNTSHQLEIQGICPKCNVHKMHTSNKITQH